MIFEFDRTELTRIVSLYFLEKLNKNGKHTCSLICDYNILGLEDLNLDIEKFKNQAKIEITKVKLEINERFIK